ncbi:MAG TPA: alpha/beta hydrolase-fold protein [Candidatus Binatia bacterium]|nr:alpha/beta hydrolase-fold protein [Candidatus Binatia bacterium]
MRLFALMFAALGLTGCALLASPESPIPVQRIPAVRPGPERILIVLLPGIADDDEDLRDHHLDEAIHRGWPEADIALTGATVQYYKKGSMVRRLHQEIVEPAWREGYRQVWIAGGSLGGLGALMYEHDHPGEATGVIVLSAWIADRRLNDELTAAGGPVHWDPGELPAHVDGDHDRRQVWRMVRQWPSRPHLAQRVWAGCGTNDRRMQAGMRMLAGVLPPGHYREWDGGHNWAFWLSAAPRLFGWVRAETQGAALAAASPAGKAAVAARSPSDR